jgi:chromosome segregation ATPase
MTQEKITEIRKLLKISEENLEKVEKKIFSYEQQRREIEHTIGNYQMVINLYDALGDKKEGGLVSIHY